MRRISYFKPAGTKSVGNLHRYAERTLPIDLEFGGEYDYKRVLEENLYSKGYYTDVGAVLDKVRFDIDINVVLTDGDARGIHNGVPLMLSSSSGYYGLKTPGSPLIVLNSIERNYDVVSMTKVLTHELVHEIRGDTFNRHCDSWLSDGACIMNPGEFSNNIQQMSSRLCDLCEDSLGV